MIVIVDYGMGNLGSVLKAIKFLNIDAKISKSSNDIKIADKLILPGVGHFSKAMEKLNSMNYLEILNKKVLVDKKPVLGICLGMQLFANFSEEGSSNGLGWIDASISKFSINDKLRWKVPHMGWNTISIKRNNLLLDKIKKDELFYFVHSYHMRCKNNKDVLATTKYSYDFTSIVQKKNIYGAQFHPEKSHEQGHKLIENFIKKA